jgi:hypothetical protein
MIIDYSFWRPGAADLAGVNGVIRYISAYGPKAVTAEEPAFLHSRKIGTALVFENGGNRADAGGTAGTADGRFCLGAARALGVPAGRPIYVTVDYDIPDYAASSPNPLLKLGPVGDYLRQFVIAVSGLYDVGVYGGYWLVSRALNAKLVTRAWQTAAWSGGQIDPRACLFQPGMVIAGGNADLDLAAWRDCGQFRLEGAGMLIGASA